MKMIPNTIAQCLKDLFICDPLGFCYPRYETEGQPLIIGQPIKSKSDAPKNVIDCPLYKWDNDEQLNNSILHALMKAAIEFNHLYQMEILNIETIFRISENLNLDPGFGPKLIIHPKEQFSEISIQCLNKHNIYTQLNNNIKKSLLILTPDPEYFGPMPERQMELIETSKEKLTNYVDGKELGFFFAAKNVAIIKFSEFKS